MPALTVSKRLDTSAEALWEVLSDFADASWIPVAGDVDVVGSGPGMTRTIGGSGGDPATETLEWIAPEKRSLAYTVVGGPLPVDRLETVVTVAEYSAEAAIGTGQSATVTWTIAYETTGDDGTARQMLDAVYHAIAGWLEEAACARQGTPPGA
ncbi:SRPBCC family protein [Mycolicibacterium sp. 3033]|nr:SRPBCC family protein [Mycolicibacterium aurantiacum]